ncbi:type IV pilus modification protein PilV [Thalassotalea sediminis]|uniref:type IV pilus modification protein PilV n=1 Tax=Thalassotalea sediminis TaxID=1759089 RepID=UPI00257376F8|nr:type IV pilus modification protein PilV [Thalassotalea sediminis]
MDKYRTNTQQRGMTFIEVLVALFLLIVGLLGAVAMQATVKKSSFDAMQRSLASSLAKDMIERMRSNDPDTLATYAKTDYGVALDAIPANRCNVQGAACTAAQMATNDMYEWELALMGADVTSGGDRRGGLIDARGCVSHNANAVQVVVTWKGRTSTTDAKKVDNCGAASDKRRQVVVEAFIN